MARKKKVAGAGVKPEPRKKEDAGVLFESWFKASTPEEQAIITEVDAHLIGLQSDKKDLRREMQPLRVGIELSRVRKLIIGEEGDASPQTTNGRIWGDYRDSHLKNAGYSKASCDRYVSMTEVARKILPDDSLITALLDHTNDKDVVQLVGGNVEKPFGKYTMFLKSDEVQMHVKDGKVLDDLSADHLIANVFDPLNAETPDTPAHMTVAVNTVVRRILTQVKGELKPGKEPLEFSKVVENARDYVRYVVESLLTVCNCPDMKDTFEPNGEDIIELDKLLTLEAAVKEANENKQKASAAKPTKKQKAKKVTHVRHAEEKAADIVIGKYTIRKNPKPQYPQTPWEIFAEGNDKPVVRCQDRMQAEKHVEQHLLPKGAASDKSPAHTKDELKQREGKGQPGHAA
jgi:hypothetical protein